MKNDKDKFDPKNFPTLGEWFSAAFEARRGVPTAAAWGIQRTMAGLGMGFHEAFDLLLKEHVLIPAGTGYVIKLSGPEDVIKKYRL